jgi:ankyrin repeat protein
MKIQATIVFMCFLIPSIHGMEPDSATRGAKRKLDVIEATQELQKWIESTKKPFPETPETVAKIKELIAAGADINIRTKQWGGSSVLMRATVSKNSEIMQALLDAGADIDAKNQMGGYTPITYAVVIKNLNLVRILLKNGADPTIADSEGWAALRMVNSKNCHCKEFKKIKDLVNAYGTTKKII